MQKWARPDLNWSYVHPKHEGYQATPRARVKRWNEFMFKKLTLPADGYPPGESGFIREEQSPL